MVGGWGGLARRGETGSGFGFKDETVESKSQTAKKEQGAEVICNDRLHGYRKREWLRISRGKIVDDAGQQHIEEPAPDLQAPGAAGRTGQTNLRDHFAAEGTLVQVCGDSLSAKGTLPHLHNRMSYSAHEFAKSMDPLSG